MSSTADVIRGGIQQVAAGKELDSNTIDSLSPSSDRSQASEDSDTVVMSENSTVDGEFGESGDTQKDSQETSGPNAKGTKEAAPGTSQKEVITVTDETGRKRKVEIDYSDKAKIKKAFEMSSGARKWQADRDQALKQAKDLQSKHAELNSNWQTLEKAYGQGGIEGLVDLLEGRKGAFQESVKKSWERQKFLEEASPEQIQALKDRESNEASRKELERIRKENEDFRKQMAEERDTVELRSLESRVHPVFNKYRFAEKLGDSTDEHMFDEMLWNTALKRLEPYEERGVALTPELIEKEFFDVAKSIRRRIGAQAEKSASRAVEQKKREATENVQAKVTSGYKSGGSAREAGQLINQGSGGLNQLLKNWGKYSSVFGGSGRK